MSSDASGATPPHTLLLLNYPAQLGAWQREHMDGLAREFALLFSTR